MSSCPHAPSTSGNAVKRLPDANRMRRRCSRGRSSGSADSALPVRSSTSSVSARSKIARGNSVNPHASLSCRAPASWPACSCSRVCVTRGKRVAVATIVGSIARILPGSPACIHRSCHTPSQTRNVALELRPLQCRRGEIGRHAILRGSGESCASSSLAVGTKCGFSACIPETRDSMTLRGFCFDVRPRQVVAGKVPGQCRAVASIPVDQTAPGLSRRLFRNASHTCSAPASSTGDVASSRDKSGVLAPSIN